jgi:hypothetical protein
MTDMGQKRTSADPHRSHEAGDRAAVTPGGRSATGTPRWVGIVVAVGLVVLFLVLHLTGVLGPGAH